MTRQYNFSYEHKAKIASRRAVKDKEKEIKKLLKRNPIRYKEILEIHGRYGF